MTRDHIELERPRRVHVALAFGLGWLGAGCGEVVSTPPAGPSVRQLADLATLPVPEDPSRTVASFPSFIVSLGAERAAFVAFPLTANDPPAPTAAPGTLYVTDGRTLHAVHTFEDYPHNLRAIGETLFFTAGDGTSWGIWTSDGAAVTLVKAIPKGAEAGPKEVNRAFDAVVGEHYCVAVWSSGVGAPGGLWASEGTPAGTVELAPDLRGQLAAYGSELVVTSYYSEATSVETLHFFDLSTGDHHAVDTPPRQGGAPVDASGTLYLTTRSADGDATTLWRVDPAGLSELHTFETGRLAGFAQAIGGRYFLSTMEADGSARELWTSDGTALGTVRVFAAENVAPGVPWQGGAMFGASDGLWSIGADEDAATRVIQASDAGELLALGGQLLFAATDSVVGREPWISDGTPAGTRRLADIAEGAPGSTPLAFTAAGSRAVFTADDGRTGFEPWAFDPAGE